MGVKVYQRTVGSKIVVSGINAKMRISNSRTRHVDAVNDLLKEGGGVVVGVDVVNDGRIGWGKKSEMHCIFNQRNQQIT